MRLIDLSPEWVKKSDKEPNPAVDRYIWFGCPKCPPEDNCEISIPVGKNEAGCWGWSGHEDFEYLSITPSIFHHCKSEAHFYVIEGGIQML